MANVARLSATSLRERAVEVEAGAHRARLRVGAHVFRDIGVVDRAGHVASVHVEELQVEAFAAIYQGFRQIGHLMEQMPPSCAAADRISGGAAGGLIAGDGNVEHREMRHFIWMIGGEAERDGCAPIVTDDRETRVPETAVHQHPDVVRDGFLVVAGGGPRRIAEAAHVRCDESELVGEQRHHAAPFVPGLWPSVE